jgi:hypothetical protein
MANFLSCPSWKDVAACTEGLEDSQFTFTELHPAIL